MSLIQIPPRSPDLNTIEVIVIVFFLGIICLFYTHFLLQEDYSAENDKNEKTWILLRGY